MPRPSTSCAGCAADGEGKAFVFARVEGAGLSQLDAQARSPNGVPHVVHHLGPGAGDAGFAALGGVHHDAASAHIAVDVNAVANVEACVLGSREIVVGTRTAASTRSHPAGRCSTGRCSTGRCSTGRCSAGRCSTGRCSSSASRPVFFSVVGAGGEERRRANQSNR